MTLVLAVLAVGRERVGVVIAGRYAQLAVYALVLIPDQAALQRVYLVGACGRSRSPSLCFLHAPPKPHEPWPFTCEKSTSTVRVVYEACYVHMLERLVVYFLGVEVLAHVSGAFQYRTAQVVFGIAALFGMARAYVVIGYEAVAAVLVYEVDQRRYEYRRYRRIRYGRLRRASLWPPFCH